MEYMNRNVGTFLHFLYFFSRNAKLPNFVILFREKYSSYFYK